MGAYYVGSFPVSEELYHYGVKLQKWGLRRYQNPDGTLTELGKIHYRKISEKAYSKADKVKNKYDKTKEKFESLKQLERKTEAQKLSLENEIYDETGRAEKVESRGKWINEHLSIDTGAQRRSDKIRKKVDKLTKEALETERKLNEIKQYRLEYENEVDNLLRKMDKYKFTGDLYKSLEEEGISKRYSDRQKRR